MSSPSAYNPSDDQEDASQSTDSDRQGPGKSPPRQGRQPHQTQPRLRQDEQPHEGSVSQPRQLLDQPDPMVESSEGQPGEGKSRPRKSRQEQSSKSKGLQSRSSKSGRKEVKGNYRDLLNSVITDAAARNCNLSDETLFASRNGASLWTSHEKDCLFRWMCLTGRNDLRSLYRAVPTKSESEIKVYLQLLEQESKKSASQTDFDLGEIPAAAEISEECIRALEESADKLAARVNDHDTVAQKNEFGENWLIDEDSAYYIDLVFDQDDEVAADQADAEEDAKPHVPNEPPSIAESDASITLLRPSSFLQLSRSLFMNSSADLDYNWQSADLLDDSVESPAIFRGAFEDLHNLTVSLTRRLVQVSLFQAMTRLRAGDSSRSDWTPVATVREVDVRSALDILGMEDRRKEYWATAARRCNVDVYTDSKKYYDGRKSTKTGVKLTYDEVEAELGMENGEEEAVVEIAEEEVDDFVGESDMFTETDSDEEFEPVSQETPTSKRNRSRSASQKRKRALSPSSFLHAETKYLNAVDHNGSLEEETRIWKVLRTDPPEGVNLEFLQLPEHPGRIAPATDDWQDTVEFEAEWEDPVGCPEPERFAKMGEIGKQARMRREALFEKLRGKINGENAAGNGDDLDGDEEMSTSEDESDGEHDGDGGDESDEEMADEDVEDEDAD